MSQATWVYEARLEAFMMWDHVVECFLNLEDSPVTS